MKIKFTLDCFKEDFLNEILLSLNYKSYYDLLQNLKKIHFDLELELNREIEENIEKDTENEEDFFIENINNQKNYKEENKKIIDFIQKEYDEIIDTDNDEIIDTDNDEDTKYKKSPYKLIYFEKENAVYIESSSKKHIPKSLVKKIKKQGGKWIKKENAWKFPKNQLKILVNDFGAEKRDYTLKNPIKEKVELNLQNKSIDKIIEVEGDIVILPLQNHPMYGKKITYDNNFNMGIWDGDLKGWKFKIAKN